MRTSKSQDRTDFDEEVERNSRSKQQFLLSFAKSLLKLRSAICNGLRPCSGTTLQTGQMQAHCTVSPEPGCSPDLALPFGLGPL